MPHWPYAVIDGLCAQVGLARAARMPAGGTTSVEPPARSALWAAPYARLVLWPVGEAGLAEAARVGQAWLDAVLKADEAGSAPVDGYLVLALAEEPERGTVRTLELSTQVCRKHVIWPDASPLGWRGLAAVGVLGLPRSTAPERRRERPDLDAEAEALWRRIEERGHGAVADEDRGAVAR